MIKQLVVFGDSWTFGDELLCPDLNDQASIVNPDNDKYRMSHCWGGIVANQFDLKFYNFGLNGMSLQSTMWTLLWWLKNHNTDNSLIVIGLTDPSRTSWYLSDSHLRDPQWNTHIHSAWDQKKETWNTIKKIHYTHSYCNELLVHNREQSIIFFDGIQHRYNIPIIQFDCYKDQTKFYSQYHAYPGESAINWIGEHRTQTNHPTKSGHIIISNRLISWINSVKIIE